MVGEDSWCKAGTRWERGERMEEQQSRERLTGMRRPGLVTFAAVMMFALGGFHILLAVSEFAGSTWELTRLDIELFITSLIFLGIFDLLIGALGLYAGFSILRGGALGLIM